MSAGVPAVEVADVLSLALADDGPLQAKGSFSWSGDPPQGMIIACPGCNSVQALMFSGSPGTGAKWNWNGSKDKPTLTPSIHHVGCWHGYLTAGVFTPC